MFIDYYQLLEISSTASQEEVVKAFRRQAMKWHPDRNKSPDASERMRLIIEAYQVLKNNEHRRRYDVELAEFNRQAKNFKAKDFYEKSFVNQRKHTTKQGATDFANSYKFKDKDLEDWINDIKIKSVEQVKKSIEEILDLSKTAVSEFAFGCFSTFAIVFFISLVVFLLG